MRIASYTLLFAVVLSTVIGSGTPRELTQAPTPKPIQLTSGGCCTLPFWSPDGKEVRYIDRPAGRKLGIYGIAPANAGQEPTLISERVEDSRIVGGYRIETAQNTTALVRLSDDKRWNVPAQGRNVIFSPDFKRIAWSISDDNLPPERQVAALWVAAVDGSGAKRITTLRRGGVSGWISNEMLLVNGQDPSGVREQVLWSLTIADGKVQELARAERIRSPVLSPSGRWIVYYTTFDPDGGNGLWLVNTAGGKPVSLSAETFGAYQWRPGRPNGQDRLLIIPFKPDAQFHELWELDPAKNEVKPVTRAETTPFKVSNGDWRVSPDGRYVAYVESSDRNLWVIELP